MAISAKDVNELRKMTGAGMMDCKKALVEAEGDFEKAIDLLRQKGQKIAAKRADREASEGNVYAHTSEDGKEGFAMALNCETEPVSKTDEFKNLGKRIFDAAIASKATSVEAIGALTIGDKTAAEHMVELSGRIGEKVEVSGYAYLHGDAVVSYVHGTSIAVLVEMANTGGVEVAEAGKDVAMQIAAMRPVAVNEDAVPADLVEREKKVGIEKAREEGKPEHILERIAEGFVKKFYQENTLLNQAFVKDNKLTVQDYLNSVQKGMTVKNFSRIAIGR